MKQLFNLDVATLEAMTDDEIRKYCEPYLKVVDLKPVVEDSEVDLDGIEDKQRERRETTKKSREEWQKEMARLAMQQGIDLKTIMPKGLKQ